MPEKRTRAQRKKARKQMKANVKSGTDILVRGEDAKRRQAKKMSKIAFSTKEKEHPKHEEYSDRITKASIKVRKGKDSKSVADKAARTAGYKITRNGKTYTGKVGDAQHRRLTSSK